MSNHPSPTRYRNAAALVIGVGQYEDESIPKLPCPVNDARAFTEALVDPEVCGFDPERVITLVEKEATHDAISEAMDHRLEKVSQGAELVILYFAGHGDEEKKGRSIQGYLLPVNAKKNKFHTSIPMSRISTIVDALEAKFVLVLLDCCHAAHSLTRDPNQPDAVPRALKVGTTVTPDVSGNGRVLIASCQKEERSLELPYLGRGLFTHHLVEGMRGKATKNPQGQIGIHSLFEYVAKRVSEEALQDHNHHQNPQFRGEHSRLTHISQPREKVVVPPPEAEHPWGKFWREKGDIGFQNFLLSQVTRLGPKRELSLWQFLSQKKEVRSIPILLALLNHSAGAVRRNSVKVLDRFSWEKKRQSILELLKHPRGGLDPGRLLESLQVLPVNDRLLELVREVNQHLPEPLRERGTRLFDQLCLKDSRDRIQELFLQHNSPYRIVEILGAGLFTDAYLVERPGSEKKYTLRVVQRQYLQNRPIVERFIKRSQDAISLRAHENRVSTVDCREFVRERIYFALRDYVPGVTLQKLIERRHPFTPLQVARILWQITQGLKDFEERGLAHGGLKPTNLFIQPPKLVVLGDLGAGDPTGSTDPARILYHYRYLPPESFGHERLTVRSDFYALGCVAFELLLGIPPFTGATYIEVASKHLTEAVRPTHPKWNALPRPMRDLLLQLLAKEPRNRPSDCQALLDRIRQLTRELTPGPPERPAPAGSPPGKASANPSMPEIALLASRMMSNLQSKLGRDEEPNERPQAGFEVELGERVEAPFPVHDTPEIDGYEVFQELGRGGMGVVYEARDLRLGRKVAIKTLFRAPSLEMKQRFFTELQSMLRLEDYPNIIRLYDFRETKAGIPCYAMKLLTGGTLQARLQAGQVTRREGLEILWKIASAVGCAHALNIVHRDIKPLNILFDERGEPFIGDFGLAKDLDDKHLTNAGMNLGTPYYMAPEQVNGKGAASPGTDVWALGVSLYQLLTGKFPFPGPSEVNVLMQIEDEENEVVPLRQLDPTIPQILEMVCLKCLERKPKRRFPNATELASALKECLQSIPAETASTDAATESPTPSEKVASGPPKSAIPEPNPKPVVPEPKAIPPAPKPVEIQRAEPPKEAAPFPKPKPEVPNAKDAAVAPKGGEKQPKQEMPSLGGSAGKEERPTSKPPLQQIGNYDLIVKLAEGGMGAVYKGRSRETGQLVAIKIIPPATAKNPVLIRRFEQEYRAAALIDHPNVVKGIDFCGTGPSPFLVMEFVDGKSLGQRIERDGPIPEDEALRLIAQVCQGLHRAHKNGLIHRDVKPDNVLVTLDGVAKLSDLSLVKEVEDDQNLTRTGRGLGTPHYMAPEQFRNAKNADVRCDIYSLGATLYAMVTGVVPFGKVGPLDCWMKKIRNDYDEPRVLNPKLSLRIDWAIRRAMSGDPDKRPNNCREFVEDLHGQTMRASAQQEVVNAAVDEWYLVYKDETGESHTVKGTTDGIRRAIKEQLLGDASNIRACRSKAGPFTPLTTHPEFRDIVIEPAPMPAPPPR